MLFSTPRTDTTQTYIGGGEVTVLDNFIIESKKFNFLDKGQNIQMGHIDLLMDVTTNGAITLQVYQDCDSSLLNKNETNDGDLFFNTVVPTTSLDEANFPSKIIHRSFCPSRGVFLSTILTLSNSQMVGDAQSSNVQIDSQTLWVREAGIKTITGVSS